VIAAVWWWLATPIRLARAPIDPDAKLQCVSYAPFRGAQTPLVLTTHVSAEQIEQTPGIGEKVAASIRAQLDDERMRSLIEGQKKKQKVRIARADDDLVTLAGLHDYWRRGDEVIESYTITGLAHGTPLATQQHGGTAGPFLLEAGISSSYHIAKFFGLTDARVHASARIAEQAERMPLAPDQIEVIPDERVEILGKASEDRRENAANAGQIDIMAIITKALTSAGLMKPPL